jgi:hypothetical protein
MKNILGYYCKELITAVKSLIVEAPGCGFSHLTIASNASLKPEMSESCG